MKLAVLTSTDIRHRYVANRLCAAHKVVAVLYENTGYSPAAIDPAELTSEERAVVEHHFSKRTLEEQERFGRNAQPVRDDSTCAVLSLATGQLNTPHTLAFLESAGVDTVAVYGTNMVKPPLLDHWPGRMVNLHLGLSPYYRGTSTNFYPLLNEEPEYVGATIHLLDPGIDSGPILKHARPRIAPGDGPHSIGCKAIEVGVDALIDTLEALERGTTTPVPQWSVPNGKLYRRKDYHPRQVVQLYEKLRAGLIPRYVERAAEVADRVRLVP